MTAPSAPSDLLDGFRWHLRAERYAPKTISSLVYGVERFLEAFPGRPQEITRRQVQMFLATPGWKDNTARAYAKGLFAYLDYLVREGVLEHSPADGLRLPRHGQPAVAPRYTAEDVAALLAACRTTDRRGLPSWIGRRDAAIVRVFSTTPARLGEVARMLVTDIAWAEELITLHNTKSDLDYVAWLRPETGDAIRSYLRVRPVDLAPLWLAQDGRRLSEHAIQQMLKRLAAAAGLEKRIHAHGFRHDFGQAAVEDWNLGDDETAQAMGHRSAKAAQIYRAAAVKRSTIRKIREAVLGDRDRRAAG